LKSGASYVYGADNKYSTMSMAELYILPVFKVIEENSVLFLWVTTNMQEEATELLKYWGFRYKTKIYWHKKFGGRKMGMGFWYRNAVEELWVCIRGKIPAFHVQHPNVITARVRQHSEKPEKFRRLIMKSIPNGKYLELFARKKVKGWTTLGFEVDGLDIRDSLQQLNTSKQ
jgi:mRNA (2'-O-methyladenosine-N6-)-methyltransferase